MKTYKCGNFVEQNVTTKNKELNYKSFEPVSLNEIDYLITHNQQKKIDQIHENVSGIKTLINLNIGFEKKYIDSYNIFYMIKEAVNSSQIEGTESTVEDIFSIKYLKNKKNKSIDETLNLQYIDSLELGKQLLTKLPICNKLILELHNSLMSKIRSNDPNYGIFRTTQNWIGPIDKTIGIASASFVPCNSNNIYDHLNELYKFINENEMNPIIKSGLVHYQFETIHPFSDGNGRIGRILIMLELINDNIIDDFYINPSFYIKKNQQEYYKLMTNARVLGELEPWIDFYLNSINESSKKSLSDLKKTVEFYFKFKEDIMQSNFKNKKELFKILNFSYRNFFFDVDSIAKELDVSYNSAKKYLEQAISLKFIVKEQNIRKYMSDTFSYLFFPK